MDSLSRLRALVPSLASNRAARLAAWSAELTGELSGSAEHLVAQRNRARQRHQARDAKRRERARNGAARRSHQAADGSLIFGADTVALGAVGFNSIRASVTLASPTSGRLQRVAAE